MTYYARHAEQLAIKARYRRQLRALNATRGVYVLTSPVGKRYVGVALGLGGIEDRWSYYSRLDCKAQPKLYNAIRKYGWDSFKKQILVQTNDHFLAEQIEIGLVACWNLQNNEFGYNIANGGRIGSLGLKRSDETRQKIGQASRGRLRTIESIQQGLETKRQRGLLRRGLDHSCSKVRIIQRISDGVILTGSMRDLSRTYHFIAHRLRKYGKTKDFVLLQ